MKVWAPLFFIVAVLSLFAVEPASKPATPYASLATYANGTGLMKITSRPLQMNPIVATMCASVALQPMEGIHANKFFDIYVSPQAESILKSGVGTYPEHSVILKRKYSDSAGKMTELYTGMIKRAKGYDPRNGDWEFFVLSGDGTGVMKSGALTSCMQCHQAYRASDYVTRTYLTDSNLYHSGDQKNTWLENP